MKYNYSSPLHPDRPDINSRRLTREMKDGADELINTIISLEPWLNDDGSFSLIWEKEDDKEPVVAFPGLRFETDLAAWEYIRTIDHESFRK